MEQYLRVCAGVDLDCIDYNMDQIGAKLPADVKMMAVVKSDGYGHGALPIAKKLEGRDDIFGFAVATAEEAMILRKAGIAKPVLILGYTFPYAYEELIENDISLTAFKEDMAQEISDAAAKAGKKAKVHIKVDTGMHRIGVATNEEGLSVAKKIVGTPNVEVEGIFTHLANADIVDKTEALGQVADFKNFCEILENNIGKNIPYRHCFNSAAAMEMDASGFSFVRVGISMYGVWPSDEMNRENISIKPALSLFSHIVYIKELPAGARISYGGTYTTTKTTKVATIPVGYGDGYPRGLSNRGYVLIRGKKAPILGRVCMDQFMADVTDIPDVKEFDKVTLIGRDNEEMITVEDLCSAYGGFPYEMICDIGKRVPKEYYENGNVVYTKDYHNDVL
ncbi:MAG: alanine racemase [Lachnospiraceae bacterium]|nr:alanine racemase [Lachnospiraceae bacterium]